MFYGFNFMGNWCYFREWVWDSRTKLCYMLQGSEISAEFHSRNLILGTCFRVIMLNVCQWSAGFPQQGGGKSPPTS